MAIQGIDRGQSRAGTDENPFRRRIIDAARSWIGPIPILGPASRLGLRSARSVNRKRARLCSLIRALADSPRDACSLFVAWRQGGLFGLRNQARRLLGIPVEEESLTAWLARLRPDEKLLDRFRRTIWPDHAPRFTILTPVYNVREDWLRTAVTSVIAQSYPRWELILIDDASPAEHIKPTLRELAAIDSRIRVISLTTNGGVGKATNLGIDKAEGDYIAFMDHDDYLEPHALHRLAEAALVDGADLIYSDEAITTEDIDNILAIPLRSAFSYDYYLCHPYFVHLIAVKTPILRHSGGIDESMKVSQDVDLVLRLIELCRTITHVPEVLYRWRMHGTSLSHSQFDRVQDATRGALQRHLATIGVAADVEDRTHHNFRDIRFRPNGNPRVAILVSPGTRRDVDLLRDGIARTVADGLFETFAIEGPDLGDGQSMASLNAGRSGNGIAARLNEAARGLDPSFTHYLFLDADLEPLSAGWLDHLLGFATRGDVGVVAPLLFDPHCRITHAGFILGPGGTVRRAHAGSHLKRGEHNRNAGTNGELLCTRDVGAVSARCMLVNAAFFHRLGGFDERYFAAYHDVDFCLRSRVVGKKVLFDAHALVLDHADNKSRAKPPRRDLRLLRSTHGASLGQVDMYSHPLFSAFSPAFVHSPLARALKGACFRTTSVIVPQPRGTCTVARVDPPGLHGPRRRIAGSGMGMSLTKRCSQGSVVSAQGTEAESW